MDDSVLKCKRNRAELILEHLNEQEPGVIKFTKEEEEENKLVVLDLELNVNRKRHYITKKRTLLTIKKQSNRRECTRRGVIKGYSDRAKALCDPQYLQEEIRTIEESFVENGKTKKAEIQTSMKDHAQNRQTNQKRTTEE